MRGTSLFHRERQRLVITAAGREYLAVLRATRWTASCLAPTYCSNPAAGRLTVRTSPKFAAKWLVHRLGRFAMANPGIRLTISAAVHRLDFAREEVNLAIRHGDGEWPGLGTVRLTAEGLFAVCSQLLLGQRRQGLDAAVILRFPLLRLEGWASWAQWFAAAGVPTPPVAGPVLDRACIAGG